MTLNIALLFRRAFTDTTGTIFTVLHANQICFESSIHLEEFLTKKKSEHLKLVFISSNDSGKDQSYISTALEKNLVSIPSPHPDCVTREYLKKHLIVSKREQFSAPALLDPEQCRVRLVASQEYGNGRSINGKYLCFPDHLLTTCSNFLL